MQPRGTYPSNHESDEFDHRLPATSFKPPLEVRDRWGRGLSEIPTDTCLNEREQRRDAIVLLIGWMFDLKGATWIGDRKGPGGKI